MNDKLIFALAMVLCIATANYARAGDAAPAAPSPATFDGLSAGNQKIAEALFQVQQVSADGAAAWSLDQIAAARQTRSWKRIFRAMKREGLIVEKTLRELVRDNSRRSAGAVARLHFRTPTIVTDGSGHQTTVRRRPVMTSVGASAGPQYASNSGRARRGDGK